MQERTRYVILKMRSREEKKMGAKKLQTYFQRMISLCYRRPLDILGVVIKFEIASTTHRHNTSPVSYSILKF